MTISSDVRQQCRNETASSLEKFQSFDFLVSGRLNSLGEPYTIISGRVSGAVIALGEPLTISVRRRKTSASSISRQKYSFYIDSVRRCSDIMVLKITLNDAARRH